MAYHVHFYHTHPQEPAQQIYSESLLVERNKSEGWKRKWLMSLNTLARQDLEKKKSGLGWKTTLVLENKYKMATNTFRQEISRKCLTTRKVWNSHLTPGRKPIHSCFTKAPAIKCNTLSEMCFLHYVVACDNSKAAYITGSFRDWELSFQAQREAREGKRRLRKPLVSSRNLQEAQ